VCRYAVKEYKSHFACFACRKAFKKTAMRDFYAQKGMSQVYHRLATIYCTPPARKAYQKQYGIDYAGLKKAYIDEVSTCPECGSAMAAMGLDFKAPRQSDAEAWEIIREMHAHGFDFRSCGCGPGYGAPRKLSELPEFLEPSSHRRRSAGERLLAGIAERRRRG